MALSAVVPACSAKEELGFPALPFSPIVVKIVLLPSAVILRTRGPLVRFESETNFQDVKIPPSAQYRTASGSVLEPATQPL